MVHHTTNLQEIFEKLIQLAFEDGLITEDEQRLLDGIQLKLDELEKAIEEALIDHYLSAEEEHILKEKRSEIMDEAWRIVTSDNVITQDESILVKALINLLRHIQLTS